VAVVASTDIRVVDQSIHNGNVSQQNHFKSIRMMSPLL